uniref:BTB domain-containing protein n=1 Tax=Chromera velia CCMP2878 TaxID=1169474 RepID=A0A0G4FUT3_9ALVE|eukprot:Cvel_3758.t1-p1 / transcript=Cvel_3758.t1 / gene=Cvel_3758 / organism=Chromera_velia_CCMP2878 / gene_product=Leucine-zipper-like transcriptional regulator 1, putative / transcript_product=Leucine-zipper-like transcriptional regulator 1, putative / location=Cvel_scaffold157:52042-60930(-) / protein_length=500 / sequence_SO=supercontig / SO=protein_coding / is_pseudo=false
MMNVMKDVFVWKDVGALGKCPTKRSLHTMVSVGDCLYVFGGYDGVQRCNDLYKYNHSYDGQQRVNDTWRYDSEVEIWEAVQTVGTPPTPRHSHSACQHADAMFIFGGYDGNYRSDFHEFHFATASWSPVKLNCGMLTPRARYRASTCVWRNRMLLFGGHDGAQHLNDFFEFNFGVVGDPAPSARDSHTCGVFGDSVYLFGGSTGQARNELYEFKIETSDSSIASLGTDLDESVRPVRGSWVLVREQQNDPLGEHCVVTKPGAKSAEAVGGPENLPEVAMGLGVRRRFCHGMAIFEGKMFVFGGYDGNFRLNDFICCHLRPDLHVDVPPSTLVRDLKGFVGNPMFSDMTFVVEGRVLYAHKILCYRCDYFRRLFAGGFREAREASVEIPNCSHAVLLALLEFVYTDHVDVPLEIAIDLLVAADRFGLERLKKLCESKILSSVNIENAAIMLQAANRHSARALKKLCFDYILRNFDAVSKTPGFSSLTRNHVDLTLEIINRR